MVRRMGKSSAYTKGMRVIGAVRAALELSYSEFFNLSIV